MTIFTSKRASLQAIIMKPQYLCVHCAQHTTATLGELVRHAHAKNQAMRQATDGSLSRVVRQRALWTSLRKTFFAPGVDSEALSDSPALAQHERLAYPCSCSQSLRLGWQEDTSMALEATCTRLSISSPAKHSLPCRQAPKRPSRLARRRDATL